VETRQQSGAGERLDHAKAEGSTADAAAGQAECVQPAGGACVHRAGTATGRPLVATNTLSGDFAGWRRLSRGIMDGESLGPDCRRRGGVGGMW
jgi:hypothetical protein